MKFHSLKEAAQFRIHESEENYWIEDYWKAAIEAGTRNRSDTIDYFLHDCTDEELFWISEVFSDLPETILSKELINAMRTRLNAIKPEEYHPEKFQSKTLQDWGNFEQFIHSIQYEVNLTEGVLDYILWKKETGGKES